MLEEARTLSRPQLLSSIGAEFGEQTFADLPVDSYFILHITDDDPRPDGTPTRVARIGVLHKRDADCAEVAGFKQYNGRDVSRPPGYGSIVALAPDTPVIKLRLMRYFEE